MTNPFKHYILLLDKRKAKVEYLFVTDVKDAMEKYLRYQSPRSNYMFLCCTLDIQFTSEKGR